MLIVNCIPEEIGWSPIQHMVTLASKLLESEVVDVAGTSPSSLAKLGAVLRGRNKNRDHKESCLLVCTGPADLMKLLNVQNWRNRFSCLAAWVIDSFWVEHIPRTFRLWNPFDKFFITSIEDVDSWKKMTGASTVWLPWGTDALRLGSGGSCREWDITRVGRQPPEWDDDLAASSAAERLGIKYRGRPARTGSGCLDNQRLIMDAYGSTKYLLAFSNLENPEVYTHPTRQYLTGRWVDALAGGTVVAGIAPRGASVQSLLWSGSTLEFGTIRRDVGLQILAAALKEWTPEVARVNHAMALRNLDWRWRIKALADVFEIGTALLSKELKELRDRIGHVELLGGAGGAL